MSAINEAQVERAALEWFQALDFNLIFGPNLAPNEPGAERANFGDTVLAQRLLGGKPSPFRPLPPAQLEPLDDKLAAAASAEGAATLRKAVHAILASAAPGGTLTPAMTAVADRWTASLVPRDSLLTTAGLTAPRR